MQIKKIHYVTLIALVLLLSAAVVLFEGGRWLVVNAPKRADLIIVLEGDDNQRPLRGLELLQAGHAPQMWLDASSELTLYQRTEADLASQWVATLPHLWAGRITVLPEAQDSTKLEADWLAPRLRQQQIRSVLIVTSEFQTHRALTIFRHELPDVSFSIASAPDPAQFGSQWWRHRQWAKRFVYESLSYLWWEAVDRWRAPASTSR